MCYRNTKQKNIILQVIQGSRIHPTIAEIYESVQKIDSTIGQATVYRNVKRFLDEGKIYQVKTKSGVNRYDYCTDHIHFECLKCGKIIDIMDDALSKELMLKFQKRSECIKNYNLMLEGYCENCRQSKNEVNIT